MIGGICEGKYYFGTARCEVRGVFSDFDIAKFRDFRAFDIDKFAGNIR